MACPVCDCYCRCAFPMPCFNGVCRRCHRVLAQQRMLKLEQAARTTRAPTSQEEWEKTRNGGEGESP